MGSTFIIAFRETLEAALIVSIVLGASRDIPGRTLWVAGGLVAGLLGAGLVALFADAISGFFDGMGRELFNAGVLLIAVLMLAWHQVWMGAHGAELAAESRQLGQSVQKGVRPVSALALVTAIAVLREGSETVLFMYGIAADGTADTKSMLMGGGLGVLSAAALGWVLYAGLVRVPVKHIFKVTGIIMLLLTAGLAAQASAYLVQAGYLPALGYDIWDSSALLAQDNPIGVFLHILVGYVARPMGIQVLVYAATLISILLASALVLRAHRAPARSAAG